MNRFPPLKSQGEIDAESRRWTARAIGIVLMTAAATLCVLFAKLVDWVLI